MKMKVLVVEDEKKVATLIKRELTDVGYEVFVSYDGVDALKQAASTTFGLVILDVGLPKKDGIAVVTELRAADNLVPVLMLTAKDETEDVVAGLDAGADDYLKKPFIFAELHARVRALIRRGEQDRGAEIRFADMRLDPVNHKVWRGLEQITLTAKEYALLAYMVRNPETVLSRANIADNCWDYPFETFTNIIDVYINYLRKKVDGNFPTKLIHTVRGKGYILKAESE